jgi:hypothetical protein
MGYVARIINRAQWEPKPYMSADDIPADAITRDLRTLGNELSLWYCDGSNEQIEDVVLAWGAATSRPDPFDIVLLNPDTLQSAGFVMKDSEGQTPVQDLRNRHVDLRELTLARIALLGHQIAGELRADSNCREFRKAEVVEILARAVRQGRVSLTDLKDEVRKKVDGVLTKN